MGTFARAVITGFGFSLGSALYKKISKQLGLEEATDAKAEDRSDQSVDPDAADGDLDNDSTDDADDQPVDDSA